MNKWLRRALLGGVAMTVMAAGAQADELSALKAQLEALQARVATIETRGATLPEGVSLVTFERGQKAGLLKNELFGNNELNRAPESRGMTISVTPTADLPAPVASIELSGYVRAIALWHTDRLANDGGLDHFNVHARGQIDVAATVDTAVGRVTGGLQFRGDSWVGDVNTVMRTAWARWQMTDAMSLTFGRTGQIATLDNVSSTLTAVDLTPFGTDNTRRNQFRLTYGSGPFNFRFGIEGPSQDGGFNNNMPDFAASMGVDMGMVGFRTGGEVGKVRVGTGTKKTGYLVNAGIDLEMGSMVSFNSGFAYTKGLGCDDLMNTTAPASLAPGIGCFNGGSLVKAWAAVANMNVNLTETTTLALSGGYFNAKNDATVDDGYSIGGALVWKPVDALQFGLAASYFNTDLVAAGRDKNLVVGLAGWFFF